MPACASEERAAVLAGLLDQLLQTVSSVDAESGAVLAHARDRLHSLAWNRAAARLRAGGSRFTCTRSPRRSSSRRCRMCFMYTSLKHYGHTHS